MRARIVILNRLAPLLAGMGGLLLAVACASPPAQKGPSGARPVEDDHSLKLDPSPQASEVRKAWSRKMSGLITDLNLSADGSVILVSTIPDPEQDDSAQFQLLSLRADGELLWQKTLEWQVRAQALSGDGQLAVISTYDDELIALDGKGKTLWTLPAACKPVLLDRERKIVCYHDDDARPGTAFELLDWSGKRLLTFPAAGASAGTSDILALKVSEDERHLALAFTRGMVTLVGPGFRQAWQRKVSGEILDIAVSAGTRPRVAVLYGTAGQGQRLAVFDAAGSKLFEGEPEERFEQLAMPGAGNSVLAYGNGPKGQYLASYLLGRSTGSKPSWILRETRYADYSSSMQAFDDLVIIGLEDNAPDVRHSHLLGIDAQGKLKWNIPLTTEEGAYLYAQAFSPRKGILCVGTDDANLSVYQISSP